MSNVVAFARRPLKFPKAITNSFVPSREEDNQRFMIEDLARSGLVPEDIGAKVHGYAQLPQGAQACYLIPYFDASGDFIADKNGYHGMYRFRYAYPPDALKKARYLQASNEELEQNGIIRNPPYLLPGYLDGDILAICEGEKKTAAVYKHLGLSAIGIGGCFMWMYNDDVHPWILNAINGRKVVIVPDGDFRRYDIAKAYGEFLHALKSHDVDCHLLDVPAKIDDWIVAGGTKEEFDALPHVSKEDLVESIASLARRYDLSFKTLKQGIEVYQNESNMMKLLRNHPAFPEIWINQDTAAIHVGDQVTREEKDAMDLLCYFQHNLGFHKLTLPKIWSGMGAIGAERERSPFLDRVRSEKWDGVPRLSTWLSRLWGCPDDEFHREAGIKFLVGSVARQINPGCKMDWMLVVIGPQGTGKSSMPAVLFDGLDTALIGKPDSKDLVMLIHSGLCSVWDELDTFRKMDMDHLKAVVSNPYDRFRPPYGRNVVLKPRRSVMYGCGNNNDFLQNDPTGYRRYVIITIDRKLDFKALEEERWQLWAEALHLYQMGTIDFSQVAGATEVAQSHVIDDPLADKISEFLLAHEVAHPGGALGMSHILFALNRERDANNVSVKRTITDTLIAMGYEKGVFKRYNGVNFQKNSWRKVVRDG